MKDEVIGRTIDEFEVGQTREFSRTFTQEDTEMMGELTGDHNPFHYDGPFVQNTRFKKPIVHGLLLGGMICHFGGDIFPGPGYLAEEMNFKFLEPVYFGDKIKSIGTVTEVDKNRRRVTFSMECYKDDTLVATGVVIGIPYQVKVS